VARESTSRWSENFPSISTSLSLPTRDNRATSLQPFRYSSKPADVLASSYPNRQAIESPAPILPGLRASHLRDRPHCAALQFELAHQVGNFLDGQGMAGQTIEEPQAGSNPNWPSGGIRREKFAETSQARGSIVDSGRADSASGLRLFRAAFRGPTAPSGQAGKPQRSGGGQANTQANDSNHKSAGRSGRFLWSGYLFQSHGCLEAIYVDKGDSSPLFWISFYHFVRDADGTAGCHRDAVDNRNHA